MRAAHVASNEYANEIKLNPGAANPSRSLALATERLEAYGALSTRQKAQEWTVQGVAKEYAIRAKDRSDLLQEMPADNTESTVDRIKRLTPFDEPGDFDTLFPQLLSWIELQSEEVQQRLLVVDDLERARKIDPTILPQIMPALKGELMRMIYAEMATCWHVYAYIKTRPGIKSELQQHRPSLAAMATLVIISMASMRFVKPHPNDPAWVREKGEVLNSISDVAGRFSALAIEEIPTGDASARGTPAWQHAQQLVTQLGLACARAANQIAAWRIEEPWEKPAPNREAATDGQVDALTADGLHMLAQLNPDGSATAVGGETKFTRVGGELREVVTDAVTQATIGVEIALRQDDAQVSAEPIEADPVPKWLRRMDQLRPMAQDLLEKNSIDRELTIWTAKIPTSSADTQTASLSFIDEKGRKAATAMSKMAQRLEGLNERMVAVSGPLEFSESVSDLVDTLRQQASYIQATLDRMNRPETRWSLIKGDLKPRTSNWIELLAAGQIKKVHQPKALKSDPPGTLFEIRFNPEPDADGTVYPPVYIHLHTRQETKINALKKLKFSDLSAIHIKAEQDRTHGPEWVKEQQASGNPNPYVHRSPLDERQFETFMKHALPSWVG